ncbi:glycosyltransferase [Candidatus Woesearchaeota archaeon]|nr:glycosyltransferase [Candidatus Woesearchaeota archaeon]
MKVLDKERFKVSVIFPSYNESENIEEAIRRVSKSLGRQLYEVIVVDDNSPDQTWKIVRNMRNPKYNVIRRTKERGLASAIARGIEEAKGNVVVWMDCDLGVPPEVVPKLVEKLKTYDVAIGSRYVSGGKDSRTFFRKSVSYLMNLFASCMLGFKVRDYTSGFAAARKKVFDKVKFSKHGFGEYFIDFVYGCIKGNYRLVEVGYKYKYRKWGVSKLDNSLFTLLKFGIQYAYRIIKIRLGN